MENANSDLFLIIIVLFESIPSIYNEVVDIPLPEDV